MTILHLIQLSNKAPQQYNDDEVVKSYKVAGVYDKGTLNEISIGEVEAFLCHSLRHFYAENSQTDSTDIAFEVKSLLYLQKRAASTSFNNHTDINLGKPFKRKPYNSRNSMDNEGLSTTLSSWHSKIRPESQPVLHIHTLNATTTVISAPRSFSSMSSLTPLFSKTFYDPFRLTPKWPLLARDSFFSCRQSDQKICIISQTRNRLQTELDPTTVTTASRSSRNVIFIG